MSAERPRYRPRHRRRSVRGPVLALLALASVLVSLAGTGAYGGYFARVTNNGNVASSNPYFTCAAAQAGSSPAAYFTYPLSETAGSTAQDISGNGRAGTYSGNVTLNVANSGSSAVCPRDKRTVIQLNGSTVLPNTSGYVYGPNTVITAPSTFTVEIWFKTTVAQGRLIGFSGSRTGTSTLYDRQLYIDTSGRLNFGVFPNEFRLLTSSAKVTDGTWHHAVGTLSSAGMFLYLDGKQVGMDTNTTAAQPFNGYWRVGYDNLATWANAGSSYFYNGSLAFASVYQTALTATQVAQHFAAGD